MIKKKGVSQLSAGLYTRRGTFTRCCIKFYYYCDASLIGKTNAGHHFIVLACPR